MSDNWVGKKRHKIQQVQEKPSLLRVDLAVLSLFFLLIVYWFKDFLTSAPVSSWDLPGHIAATELISRQLFSGRFTFYDRWWFSGWPAFQFYGFLPHLLAAILSKALSLVSSEPSRLSVHILMVFGCATLPVTAYFSARALVQDYFKERLNDASVQFVFSVSVAVSCCWFLNHDQQWYGIGAAAPLNIGLFSQVFGWHFMLLQFAGLFYLIVGKERTGTLLIAISLCVLLLSHQMTAVFSTAGALLAWIWFFKARKSIFVSHLLGIMLAGFWLVPFFAFSGTYTVLDIFRPQGDFLELFMRYPLYGVLQSIKFWGTENFQLIDFFQLLIWFLLLYILLSRRVFEARLVIPFFVINLILVLLFSSGYVATSLPIGFHYYRFLAYAFLMMIFLVSVAPTFLLVGNSEDTGVKSKKLVLAAFVLVYGAGLANIVSLPHYERSKIQASLSLDYLNYEKEVIKALAADSTPGRVFVEYTDGQAPFSFLSVHYIESRLRAEANRETLNGLFIQSSLSYRMPVVSANLLGARTYNVPLLFTDRAQLSDDVKVRQLQDFGVSHLVVSSASFLNRVRGYAVEPPTSIGPYHIVKILTDAPKMVSRVTKPLIGYLDLEGNLPFKFLEFYFYARNELWPNFELVNLENANDYIPELRAAIINSSHSGNDPLENKLKSKNIEIVRLNYFQPYILNHYSVWYQHNVELDSFNAVEKYFDQEFRLENQISRFRENFSEQNENPTMTWSKDGQAFEVSGLNPGQLYRVNYSFFPYWQCDGAELFRGGEERIMLASNNSTVSCNYSRWNAGSSWVGMLLSLTALVFLISRRSKKPKS